MKTRKQYIFLRRFHETFDKLDFTGAICVISKQFKMQFNFEVYTRKSAALISPVESELGNAITSWKSLCGFSQRRFVCFKIQILGFCQ